MKREERRKKKKKKKEEESDARVVSPAIWRICYEI
jgi:hypothetical protein